MPAPIYFLKAEIASAASPGGATFAVGFAERVRRGGAQLWAETIQVPAVVEENGRLHVRPLRLPDRRFTGFAYRMAAPPWFEASGGSESGARNPTAFDLKRCWVTTPFGRFCRHPEVRRALAEDKLAQSLAPYLAVPDLLIHEDGLRSQWEEERPGAAAEARAAVAAADQSLPGLSPDLRNLRGRILLAALRRIDASAVGREVFEPCPPYFGEPYLGGNVLTPFKIGIVIRAQYWPKPETEARSRAWRSDPKIVRAAETTLFPLVALADSAEEFAAAVAIWRAVAPLREFEARSPLPLFPFRTSYPEGIAPPGFRIRIAPPAVRAAGGGPFTLAALGLSPYVAEPFAEFAAKRRDLLSVLGEDTLALAVGKWGGASLSK